jgi:RimJ/RimL family protein N-acetyltransferase
MEKIKSYCFKNKRDETVAIRVADVIDARQILELSKTVVAEDIYQLLTLKELDITVTSEENWIISYRGHPNRLILVAEIDDEIVGLLDFCNGNRDRTAHAGEFGMSMAKSFRGLGIGTRLLQTFIEWAEGNHTIEKINLTVHSNNIRARALYARMGFAIEGIKKSEIKYEDGQYVDAVLMGRFV